jgi:hypothetical protein
MGKRGKGTGGRSQKRPDDPSVVLKSVGVGGKKCFRYNSYDYCTFGEMQVAQLLDRQGIGFMPDCRTIMLDDNPKAKRSRVYFVPDFFFVENGKIVPFLWYGDKGNPILIHGLECKARLNMKRPRNLLPSWRIFKKQRLLWQQHGHLVIVVSDAEVEAWAAGDGLPLKRVPLTLDGSGT